jgi:hypothetical protein
MKLAPLLHDGVHEGEREEHRLPRRVADRVELVLVVPRGYVLRTPSMMPTGASFVNLIEISAAARWGSRGWALR